MRNRLERNATMQSIIIARQRSVILAPFSPLLLGGAFAALIAAAGCAPAAVTGTAPEPGSLPDPTAAEAEVMDWVGCYDLELGPWSPEMDLGADSIFIVFPPRILLDSVPAPSPSLALPVEPGQEQLAVHPAPGSPPSPQRFSSWRKVHADSIQIVWASYSGVRIQLAKGDSVHHGYARTGWDFPGRVQTAPVAARRVACSSPLPEEQASYRRFPREVRLDDGQAIVLGERFPDDVPMMEMDPTGLFADAEVVEVRRTADGIVHHVVLRYPPGIDPNRLTERFIEVYGPPTTLRDTGRFNATWSGRDTVSYLTIGGDEPGRYSARFIMLDPRFW
jgi:hypothetical protein